MTETTTTTEEHSAEKLCQWGSRTDKPCWRAATETDSGSDAWLCSFHADFREHGKTADAWLLALEATRDFLESEAVQNNPDESYRDLVYEFNETVTDRAAEATINERVAEILAAQGPKNRGPKDPMLRLVGAHQLVRSDAMTNALAILGGERKPEESERLLAYASVKYAAKLISKEYQDFRAKHIDE